MAHEVSSPKVRRETLRGKQGVWRTYDATDGLPGGVICLLQDHHGYLWLGTVVAHDIGIGLCRYDGTEFITFTTDDGLVDNCVRRIYEDHQGRLWLGTPSGLSCFDRGQFTTYTTDDGLADNYVTTICEDRQGQLWFGTREGGTSCYDGQRFITYTQEDGLSTGSVYAICEDRHGRIWFGGEEGACCFDGQRFTSFAAEDGLAGDGVKAICCDRYGRLWFGTDDGGVAVFDGERFTPYTTADGLAKNHIWTICEDHEGTLWFGFEWSGGGVSRLMGQREDGRPELITYTTDDGLLDDLVYDIIEDAEGHLWFAHYSGITCYDSDTLQVIVREPGTHLQDRAGRLWFGNSNKLCCMELDAPETCRAQTFPSIVLCVMEDSNDGFWVGTQEDGLYHYESAESLWKGVGKHFTTQQGLNYDTVLSVLETKDGTIWAGTWGEGWIWGNCGYLCRLKEETFEAMQTPHPVVRELFADSRGRIWMGGWAGGGVSCYDGSTLRTYTTTDGLSSDGIQSIIEDDMGRLWIGTQQGLCCFDGERFVTYGKEQGLLCLCHRPSAKDARGHLWFSTSMGGIYRYDGKHFQQLTTDDGLPSNCITGLVPQSDGSMIIGTSRGMVHYRPTARIPPRVEIQRVVADEVYQNPAERSQGLPLQLTTIGADLLTISYRGLSLSTHRMRYSYILEGYDTEWQDTWADHVRYENLPVGNYTFKVTAINRDLVESEAPAVLTLTVVPDPRDAVVQALQSDLRLKDRQLALLGQEIERKYHFETIIGTSETIQWVRAMMARAIDSGLNVLITGETGVGKELVAKGIHYNSPRQAKLPVALNCAAVQKELIASELFGHRKGAFTGAIEDMPGCFEVADGSTLLLDEIGDMPLEVQANLLRVLEEGKVQRMGEHTLRNVDVRVIAMTNRNLQEDMKEGRFREDLYYRLNGFNIYVPPLRERREDIPLLAAHFLQEACEMQGRTIDGFAPDVMERLCSHPWPGNVRELEHEIYRAVAVAEEGMPIGVHHLSSQMREGESPPQEASPEQLGLSASLKRLQRQMIEDALRESDGNRTQAAKRLEIDVANLRRLIRQLGIQA